MGRRLRYTGLALVVTIVSAVFVAPFLLLDALLLAFLAFLVVIGSIAKIEAPKVKYARSSQVRSRIVTYGQKTASRTTTAWLPENPFERAVLTETQARPLSEGVLEEFKDRVKSDSGK